MIYLLNEISFYKVTLSQVSSFGTISLLRHLSNNSTQDKFILDLIRSDNTII